jgi:uncharacterized protein (TIRG00374 family)
MEWRRVFVGFATAAVFLGGFVWTVGADRVLGALRDTDPVTYGMAVGASLAATALFGAALYWLLTPVPGAPRGRAFLVGYAAGVVLSSIAPWGRGGGSFLTAAALHWRGEGRFEEVLGATLTGTFLSSVGHATVAATGLAVVVGTDAGEGLATPTVLVVAVAVVFAVAGVVVFVAPEAVVVVTAAIVAAFRGTVGRVWPAADRLAVDADAVGRVERLLATVRSIATRPWTVGTAAGLSALGALVGVVPLWASLRAVAVPVAFPTLMVLTPAGGLAALVPLPGGSVGVEVTLVGLLVVVGVSAGDATAGVLLYRVATYWLGLVLGGTLAVALDGVGELAAAATR